MPEPTLRVRGFQIYKGLLDASAQAAMIADLR
ncbi:MAG TPA: alpha-ketoglutarate-dependent dioxygenase AlkB, partial [Rhodobacteraceae bacterium]|nr:alpha-ketoglutarate-dependent dioxygenase AlkB [Paracoccaceae bacterium]